MRGFIFSFYLLVILSLVSCSTSESTVPPNNGGGTGGEKISEIDLSNWKVTLPIGSPSEIEPPEILDYANNSTLKKYMFNDTKDGTLVFFTEPGSTTANSNYPRTELREQITPGSDKVNWTYDEGGRMKGTLKVDRVSGQANNLDRIIVMQIHGRLTNEQRDLIGEDDNNAPPVLKIYWDDGRINVRRKILKDLDVSDTDILKTDAWKDESHWFDKSVGFNAFTIDIEVKGSEMKVTLSHEESFVFDDIHVEKWGIFENYFKAGNYLQTSKEGSYSEVKYYSLEVTH